MKDLALVFFLFFYGFDHFSQTVSDSLEENDTKIRLMNNGQLFYNEALSLPGYEIPLNSGLHTLFLTNFLGFAKNGANDTIGFLGNYQTKELFNGPVANDYSDTNYLNRYGQGIWKINRFEVENHIANWNNVNYTIPNSILNWPAHGNILNGEARFLAPFTDVNEDGLYSPELGDYPRIRGEYAAFMILNDENGSHSFSNLDSMKIELHVMIYQYAVFGFLNHTNFLSVKLVNRSPETYTDFIFGLFNDFDLGNHTDDFIGTNTAKRLSYVYNADLNDEAGTNSTGYGMAPPAFGVTGLNKLLHAHIPGDVSNTASILNCLIGKNPDGSDFLDDNNIPTKFAYNGTVSTGYTETNLGNVPGDRKSFVSFQPEDIVSSGESCYDFAYVYARDEQATGTFSSVESLFEVTDSVQEFHNLELFECYQQYFNEITENPLQQVLLYPNPVRNYIYVKNSAADSGFNVFSMEGKLLNSGKVLSNAIKLENLNSGMYIIQLTDSKTTATYSFIKE